MNILKINSQVMVWLNSLSTLTAEPLLVTLWDNLYALSFNYYKLTFIVPTFIENYIQKDTIQKETIVCKTVRLISTTINSSFSINSFLGCTLNILNWNLTRFLTRRIIYVIKCSPPNQNFKKLYSTLKKVYRSICTNYLVTVCIYR